MWATGDLIDDSGTGTVWGARATAFPSEPDTAGQRGLIWYDAANDTLKFYNGSGWQSLH
jgi:hypothetical protein